MKSITGKKTLENAEAISGEIRGRYTENYWRITAGISKQIRILETILERISEEKHGRFSWGILQKSLEQLNDQAISDEIHRKISLAIHGGFSEQIFEQISEGIRGRFSG